MPVGNPITYAQVEALRVAIPLGVIDYSQSSMNDYTDRRSDCSGLLSYVWALPTSGPGVWLKAYSTQSLYSQGLIEEIPFGDLLDGDAIGFCGPDTANGGGGHIALWREGDRTQTGRHHVWDHGSGIGPKDRWVRWDGQSTGWLHPSKLKAWRYVHITDAAEEVDMPLLINDTKTKAVYEFAGIDPPTGKGRLVGIKSMGTVEVLQAGGAKMTTVSSIDPALWLVVTTAPAVECKPAPMTIEFTGTGKAVPTPPGKG